MWLGGISRSEKGNSEEVSRKFPRNFRESYLAARCQGPLQALFRAYSGTAARFPRRWKPLWGACGGGRPCAGPGSAACRSCALEPRPSAALREQPRVPRVAAKAHARIRVESPYRARAAGRVTSGPGRWQSYRWPKASEPTPSGPWPGVSGWVVCLGLVAKA